MLRRALLGGALILLLAVPAGTHAQDVFVPPCEYIDPAYWEFHEHCAHLVNQTHPVILVPGLLASYNKKLLFKDQPGGAWGFVPLDRTYRGLIERLESAGLQQGEDLFVAFYDWRQSNVESAAEYLKPLIEHAKEVSGDSKVNIVAHSMGGLVARSYIQSDAYADDVDQLIMLGTPNTGASDAYIAWEGGFFPDRWGVVTKWYIKQVEEALKKNRDQHLVRPASFREFFPSLQELLPINAIVKKANELVPHTQLAAQNQFLLDLNANSNLLDERGVDVASIAGTNKSTINQITVDTTQSEQDTTLSRWRDGHANPDPPAPNATTGDETVLLSSAHINDAQTNLANVSHVDLPEEAQDRVIELLNIDEPEPQQFHYEPPQAIAGWVVLSPVDVKVTGPGGKELSNTTNTFGTETAVYDDDPSDPNDPKLIMIADPPVGEYKVELTGTGTGEYTVITTYADQNEVRSTEREGTTVSEKKESFSVAITAQGSFVAPSGDIQSLTNELEKTLLQLLKNKHISKQAFAKLVPHTTKLFVEGKAYTLAVAKYGASHTKSQAVYKLLKDDFKRFSQELDKQLLLSGLNATAKDELLRIHQALTDAGL